jgi:hypothetical protein
MTKEIDERDFKPLIRNVKAATSAVLERLAIDSIDKNTENQLIHICLNDANCVYGFYNMEYLENKIECELLDIYNAHPQK